MRRRSLTPVARGLTMLTMENGNERTRYPLAIAFATTKALGDSQVFQSSYIVIILFL